MRREGFELGVCPPKVLFKRDESGQKLEPIEEVVVEVSIPVTLMCLRTCMYV
jgi:GTP-binding protein